MESTTDKHMNTNNELENCLTKAISKFEVRDIFTKFGIPHDVEITLKMQLGENSEPIASCSIPKTHKKDSVCESRSTDEFKESIKDQFLNPALEEYGLSQYIPADVQKEFAEEKVPLVLSFDTSSPEIPDIAFMSFACCRRCPHPAGHLCCFVC